uniref:Thioredoxin domain-containing protein n=1 Tax=Cuerna arida TaxID=1464854 RepID=A0A1B6FH87_9HEMI
MGVLEISKYEDFNSIIKGNELVVVHFYADWAEQCKNMDSVLIELSKRPDLQGVKFAKLSAEDIPEVSLAFKITAVPTFVLLRKGTQVDRVDGANAAELTQKVTKQANKVIIPAMSEGKEDLESRLKTLITSSPVMLFMKGDRQEPKCGFSRQIVQILNEHNASYKTFDILQDQTVREGLKKFSNWPTYPQLYISGELVGGLDIVKELVASGELKEMLPKSLEDRLKKLINQDNVMLFMKGSPSSPKCGFSRQIVQILNEHNASYKTFDILQDQTVREGLKKFSNWPTYPQLYISGELVGGLDIVKELVASGELKEMLPKSLEDRLKKLINQDNVMLFMKGSPSSPKCGFSKQIVALLNETNVKFGTFDILEDEEVRQGLKEFSQWPTYPQLYVRGELVGGLDIVKELQATGELMKTLQPSS